jgi:pimeloyl-ACP methyl ester carboxylesterase
VSKLLFQPPVSRYPMNPDHIYLHSKSGSKLQVMYMNRNARYTIIFSHGNAEDIYLVQTYLQSYFLKKVSINAIVYEYTGYGEANGKIPADSSLYDDIETVYLYLTENMSISPKNIILYGRSIGSGPSCYLAEKHEVAGLILHSPLMSALRVVLNLRWTLPFDKFPNIDRVPNINCPIFIIHGRRDEIVPFYHAIELHANSKLKYPPYYVDGAGHNNIEKFAPDYLERIN